MLYELQRDGEIQFSKPVRLLSILPVNKDIAVGSIIHTITFSQNEAESGIISITDANQVNTLIMSNENGKPISQAIFNNVLVTSIAYTTNTDAITSSLIVEIQSTSIF